MCYNSAKYVKKNLYESPVVWDSAPAVNSVVGRCNTVVLASLVPVSSSHTSWFVVLRGEHRGVQSTYCIAWGLQPRSPGSTWERRIPWCTVRGKAALSSASHPSSRSTENQDGQSSWRRDEGYGGQDAGKYQSLYSHSKMASSPTSMWSRKMIKHFIDKGARSSFTGPDFATATCGGWRAVGGDAGGDARCARCGAQCQRPRGLCRRGADGALRSAQGSPWTSRWAR